MTREDATSSTGIVILCKKQIGGRSAKGLGSVEEQGRREDGRVAVEEINRDGKAEGGVKEPPSEENESGRREAGKARVRIGLSARKKRDRERERKRKNGGAREGGTEEQSKRKSRGEFDSRREGREIS
jgi:hypothetical protein